MSLLSFVIHVCYTRKAIAAPVTNLTALATEIAPPWVSSPGGCGTWNLLYSCGFTILLCVYTAIHLNIPSPDDTKFTLWLRKTKWVAIAILAPEVVVYTAFEQWWHAKQFLAGLRKIVRNSEDKGFKVYFTSLFIKGRSNEPQDWYSGDSSSKPFDMVYAYYVVMGGFVADIDHIHNSLKRVTITLSGIGFMASEGYFPRIKRGDIQDKSKADILAKGLVCVQVLWTVGQVVERKLASYPLTMLEVHTIVHVVCALLMYGLWFQKPLNVQDPTLIDFREDPELLGVMLQFSVDRSKSLTGFYKDLSAVDPLHVDLDAIGGALEPHCLQEIKERPEIYLPVTEGEGQPPPQISTLFCLSSEDSHGVVHRYPMGHVNWEYTPASEAEVVCTVVTATQLHFHISSVATESLLGHSFRSNGLEAILGRMTYARGEDCVAVGKAFGYMVGNIIGKSHHIYPPPTLTTSMTMYAAGVLFSACHLAAWNWDFPSSTVRIIWRSFAVAATGTGPLIILFTFLYSIFLAEFAQRKKQPRQGFVHIRSAVVYLPFIIPPRQFLSSGEDRQFAR
ncbi:hypothetical protein G7Y89_g2353 [Cudoniella acicularis]|uniref:Intimal thickness related receptor IRP domain-containing protein n=1 Tax=Cudoniella acicularis TaxID=354080 RepID=A0A8H4RTH7_9HELO|nr:hypothetical protein G7Y89_g2353 [Cudoniella acicularis]